MTQVKKRDGRIEEFVVSKIENSVKKAGATAEQAAQVAKTVAAKVVNKAQVTAAALSGYVVTALRKLNKKAAAAYVAYRNKKLKEKKKKKT
jgi:anaerobic ribonucleoside-triphosphate reductase